MNKVILMGRLTRDADVRYTSGPETTAVARFTLAVNRRYSKDGQQSADFISCVAFGKAAEFCERYARQGIKLVIEGRIQTGSYTNKDGNKVYTTDVVVENMEFAESKGADSTDNNNTGSSRLEPQSDTDGFMSIPDGVDDEGLPFN